MRRAGYKQVVALMLRCCVKQGLASGLASCLGIALAEWHSLIQNLAEAMKSALCEQNLLAKQA